MTLPSLYSCRCSCWFQQVHRAQKVRQLIVIMVTTLALVACSGNADAPTARFEVVRLSGEEGAPESTFKGIGNFSVGDINYTLFLGSEAVGEHLELGNGEAYNRFTGEEDWIRSGGRREVDGATSFRNKLVASTDAVEYLRSVGENVTVGGTETVRGVDATHYRANVRLADLGVSPKNDRYPVEVWVGEDGRTRRYRSRTPGSEEILIWEFFDFGVEVDLSPPPPGKGE